MAAVAAIRAINQHQVLSEHRHTRTRLEFLTMVRGLPPRCSGSLSTQRLLKFHSSQSTLLNQVGMFPEYLCTQRKLGRVGIVH